MIIYFILWLPVLWKGEAAKRHSFWGRIWSLWCNECFRSNKKCWKLKILFEGESFVNLVLIGFNKIQSKTDFRISFPLTSKSSFSRLICIFGFMIKTIPKISLSQFQKPEIPKFLSVFYEAKIKSIKLKNTHYNYLIKPPPKCLHIISINLYDHSKAFCVQKNTQILLFSSDYFMQLIVNWATKKTVTMTIADTRHIKIS